MEVEMSSALLIEDQPSEVIRMFLENMTYQQRVGVSRVCRLWCFLVKTFPKMPQNYTFSRKFGSLGSEDGQFKGPVSIAYDEKNERYIVADCDNHRIQAFDLEGNFIFKFGQYGTGPGQFKRPGRIAVHPTTGLIYLADWDNHRVQVYDEKGVYQWCFGSYGNKPGQFYCPSSVVFNANNNTLVVADCLNHRAQIFDAKDGAFLKSVGAYGNKPDQMNSPYNAAIDYNDVTGQTEIYVVDRFNNRIQVLEESGKFIRNIGAVKKNSFDKGNATGDGYLAQPSGVVIEQQFGLVLVSDNGNSRIQAFDRQGNYRFQFGGRGDQEGHFNDFRAAMICPTGELAVPDTGNHRIQFFAPSC